MQSFHNDIEVKRKYVARTEQHRKADEIIRGTGWDGSKGCAVGCTLERYEHALYPVELGIPEWLAHVEDTLFEGMSADRAMLWPSEFLVAIPLGVTEDQFERNVKAPFLVIVLESALKNFDHDKFPDCAAAVRGSIALWKRKDIGGRAWSAASSAAGAPPGRRLVRRQLRRLVRRLVRCQVRRLERRQERCLVRRQVRRRAGPPPTTISRTNFCASHAIIPQRHRSEAQVCGAHRTAPQGRRDYSRHRLGRLERLRRGLYSRKLQPRPISD